MRRILSIQSHVVSGYVGNRAATFPLQLLGHEVDVMNTVQFSNHTGYNKVRGTRFSDTQLRELFEGLCDNGLDTGYSHLLSGYIGNSGNVRAVEEIARSLRRTNPDLVFVLDPVLGDDGALYVPEELVSLYRDVLCPLADIITPNQFEAEALSGISISSLEDARAVCNKLHSLGVPNVVITSLALPAADAQSEEEKEEEKRDRSGLLYLVGSQQTTHGGEKKTQCFYIAFPRLYGYFTGSGDLFTALVAARHASVSESASDSEKEGAAGVVLAQACELAIATQAGVMRETQLFQQQTGVAVSSDSLRRGNRPSDMVRGFELRIIQSQNLITHPVLEHRAVLF
ncbi:putative pyridoxal kinase [Coemansia sp. BCRC 34490]|nr:putative pyridoxal kinase [Coemansia sp. Benny D160-2]KAJ2761602.1 putative pyridoxal kinase [Coemansia sp. BCRC 34490]